MNSPFDPLIRLCHLELVSSSPSTTHATIIPYITVSWPIGTRVTAGQAIWAESCAQSYNRTLLLQHGKPQFQEEHVVRSRSGGEAEARDQTSTSYLRVQLVT